MLVAAAPVPGAGEPKPKAFDYGTLAHTKPFGMELLAARLQADGPAQDLGAYLADADLQIVPQAAADAATRVKLASAANDSAALPQLETEVCAAYAAARAKGWQWRGQRSVITERSLGRETRRAEARQDHGMTA